MAVSTTTFEMNKPFKYWCQKVLPAVYDDSLSYYELLCKVSDYLNRLAEITNTQSDAITELQETLAEFMAGTFDPYIEEKIDEWFAEHEPDIVDELERLKTNVEFSTIYGGDGTLVFDIFDVDSNLTLAVTHRQVSRDKKANLIRFDVILSNTSENTVTANSTLFKLKNFYLRKYNDLQISVEANEYKYTADSDITNYSTRVLESITPTRISLVRDNDDVDVVCNFNVAPNRELIITGEAPIATALSWICSSFYNTALANSLCYYFLNGDGDDSWEGTFEYSNNNAYRTDPQYLKTDCSGMVYIAYKNFGFHPQNSIQPSYLTDGIFVAYAAKDEKLDLSNALPGDIICFQRDDDPDKPVTDQSSWTHCALYAGDNVCYEMSNHYPQPETVDGCVDGYGPYRIITPADEYKMSDQINALTGYVFHGYNRCVVRFL